MKQWMSYLNENFPTNSFNLWYENNYVSDDYTSHSFAHNAINVIPRPEFNFYSNNYNQGWNEHNNLLYQIPHGDPSYLQVAPQQFPNKFFHQAPEHQQNQPPPPKQSPLEEALTQLAKSQEQFQNFQPALNPPVQQSSLEDAMNQLAKSQIETQQAFVRIEIQIGKLATQIYEQDEIELETQTTLEDECLIPIEPVCEVIDELNHDNLEEYDEGIEVLEHDRTITVRYNNLPSCELDTTHSDLDLEPHNFRIITLDSIIQRPIENPSFHQIPIIYRCGLDLQSSKILINYFDHKFNDSNCVIEENLSYYFDSIVITSSCASPDPPISPNLSCDSTYILFEINDDISLGECFCRDNSNCWEYKFELLCIMMICYDLFWDDPQLFRLLLYDKLILCLAEDG